MNIRYLFNVIKGEEGKNQKLMTIQQLQFKILTFVAKPATMKKLQFGYLLLACLTLAMYACEKEVISTEEVTAAHFVGRWPLKLHIEIVKKNNVISKNDTVRFSPIDTLTYTNDGKFIRKNDTVAYSLNAVSETISYATKPTTTVWKIKWLRLKSIILTQERTETVSGDTFVYYTEEQLIK